MDHEQRIADLEQWRETAIRQLVQAGFYAGNLITRLIAAEKDADRLAVALGDCLSTVRHDDKTTVITGDRQEMWASVLAQRTKPEPPRS